LMWAQHRERIPVLTHHNGLDLFRGKCCHPFTDLGLTMPWPDLFLRRGRRKWFYG
jgi:hypothetical protein